VQIFYRNGDLAANDPSVEILKTRTICLKKRKEIAASSQLIEDVSVSLVI
jgi:hypothetical protein